MNPERAYSAILWMISVGGGAVALGVLIIMTWEPTSSGGSDPIVGIIFAAAGGGVLQLGLTALGVMLGISASRREEPLSVSESPAE